MKVVSLDTETTGVDVFHSARPFFVVSSSDEGSQYWEWRVDPITREVAPDPSDLHAIRTLINDADQLILQNARFDVGMLRRFGIEVPWEKVHDTLMASHILASNHPHDLTSLALEYLAVDILPYEKHLEKVVQECRRYCRSHLPDWRIAKEDQEEMPSAKQKTFKFDYWLPRAVAMHELYDADHEYHTALSSYSIIDAEVTLELWKRFEQLLQSQDLWAHYLFRMKLLPVIDRMTERGVTYSGERLQELKDSFQTKAEECHETCQAIASYYGFNLTIPKGSRNQSLDEFIFNVLKLPSVAKTDKGNNKMDKEAFSAWENTLTPGEPPYVFVRNYSLYKKTLKSVCDCENYERFGVGIHKEPQHHPTDPGRDDVVPRRPGPYVFVNWHVLHPNINPTGSATLRFSFSNPNSANVGKGNIDGVNEHSIRYAFGPAPGREWWALDGQNLELRIPSYEAGETDLIWIFEHPDEPPYYGSYHYVVFDLLHPEKFKEHGKNSKKVFAATWYQWVKNGNFAVIYGAQEAKADQTYRVYGAYQKIRQRFPKIAALSDRMMRQAERYGFVNTIPSKRINPRRGYPLLCTRTEYGRILPTVPLNYHIQSTAMEWTCTGMVDCQERLDQWRIEDGFDGHIAMQVHDELVFDFPKVGNPIAEWEKVKLARMNNSKPPQRTSNLWRIKALQRIMERSGEYINVPTPCGVDFHPDNWGTGVTLT